MLSQASVPHKLVKSVTSGLSAVDAGLDGMDVGDGTRGMNGSEIGSVDGVRVL